MKNYSPHRSIESSALTEFDADTISLNAPAPVPLGARVSWNGILSAPVGSFYGSAHTHLGDGLERLLAEPLGGSQGEWVLTSGDCTSFDIHEHQRGHATVGDVLRWCASALIQFPDGPHEVDTFQIHYRQRFGQPTILSVRCW